MSVPSYPVRGSIYKFATALVSQADTKLLKSNPTLASGDVKASTDGGSFANLGTLPTVSPSSDRRVQVVLSAAEMGGQQVEVAFVDAAGAEWCDQFHAVDPLVLPVLTSGTAQSGSTSSTIKLASAEPSDQDNYWRGAIVRITGGTGVGQARDVSASVQSTHVLTVVPNWDTTPDNTSTYDVIKPPAWIDPNAQGLEAHLDLISTDLTTALARLGAWAGSGVNTVLGAFKALLRADASAPSDIGGTFAPATDSTEAIRDYTAAATDIATLLSRLSSARAGYLDNLNVGGLVASAAGIAAITQAQRVRVMPPPLMERPDAGNTHYRVWIYCYNEMHEAEDLDSDPTITVENNLGDDRSANLSAVSHPGTGIYYVDYDVDLGHAIEGLVVKVAATEGTVTTNYAAASVVLETSSLATAAALAAAQAAIDAVKAKTDLLAFTGTDVKATLDGETVVLTDGSLSAAKIATGALSAIKFAADACNKIADHVRRRQQRNVEASSDGDTLALDSHYGDVQARQNANTTDNPGDLTVYQTDGITELGQIPLAEGDPSDPPITGTNLVP